MWKYTFTITECLETHMKDLHSLDALQDNQETSISVVIEMELKSTSGNYDKHKGTSDSLWKVIFKSSQRLNNSICWEKNPCLSDLLNITYSIQQLWEVNPDLQNPFAGTLTSRTSLLSIIVPGCHFLHLGHPTFSAKYVWNHFFTRLIVITLCLTNTVDVRLQK